MTTITFTNLPDGTVDVQLRDPAGEPEGPASVLAAFVLADAEQAQALQQAHIRKMREHGGFTDPEIFNAMRSHTLAQALRDLP